LANTFGTPPEYWLNLQHVYDLAAAREEHAAALERIRSLVAQAHL
jgi:plasmid maintenance system antidote protein VapI